MAFTQQFIYLALRHQTFPPMGTGVAVTVAVTANTRNTAEAAKTAGGAGATARPVDRQTTIQEQRTEKQDILVDVGLPFAQSPRASSTSVPDS